jgi:hypothetical protein
MQTQGTTEKWILCSKRAAVFIILPGYPLSTTSPFSITLAATLGIFRSGAKMNSILINRRISGFRQRLLPLLATGQQSAKVLRTGKPGGIAPDRQRLQAKL